MLKTLAERPPDGGFEELAAVGLCDGEGSDVGEGGDEMGEEDVDEMEFLGFVVGAVGK